MLETSQQEGPHGDYHTPRDAADTLDYAGLTAVARVVLHTVVSIANGDNLTQLPLLPGPAGTGYKQWMAEPGIVVVSGGRLSPVELSRLLRLYFEDMVKYVVDVSRGVAAVGGEMHADAEQVLLEDGSRQPDLWGANYYPGRGREECIEYTSLINIRPAQGNRSMEIQDAAARERVRELTFALIGEGEPLP